jgi:thioredoxin reductase
MVPELEDTQVTDVEHDGRRFHVRLATGERFTANRVVLAVGITHFANMPAHLQHLPSEYVSHSSRHTDPAAFRGRRVTVVGAGASAIDLAVLLHEAGADVSLVARRQSLRFNDPPPTHRTLWEQLRSPSSPIGPGSLSKLYCDLPGLFRYLPERMRLRIVPGHNGPAAGWPMKNRFVGKVPALLGCDIAQVEISDGQVRMLLRSADGTTEHVADHVIAATGYRVDLRRLAFLGETLCQRIRSVQYTPVLSPRFESSVPGLYFVGTAAANTFGPMMRFACGADWTARRVSGALADSYSRSGVTASVIPVPQRSA